MSFTTRTVAIVTGAAAASALAGAAAFAAPADDGWTARMGGQLPAHMADMDGETLADMEGMMAGDATVGEMHQWMNDQGISIGQMRRDMAGQGMNLGGMHRSMASPDR